MPRGWCGGAGELMLAAGQARPGAMAAVLGLATAQVEEACNEASGDAGVAVPANLNAPGQTVISGDPAGGRRGRRGRKARGAKRVIRSRSAARSTRR